MKRLYHREVRSALEASANQHPRLLTLSDIEGLPLIVQKYLVYAGAVGKPRVFRFKASCHGLIRSKPEDPWMRLTSEQYNLMGENPSRIFYIRAFKMGIPAAGIHLYKNARASMKIKLAGLFTIVDAKGKEMNQSETVTVLVEMCFMAPGALTDKNISWEILDDLSVRATYTNGNQTVSGILYFNPKGELINFISNDRYEADGKTFNLYPFLTPAGEYREQSGLRLASDISLIFRKPEGDFCYGRFFPDKIEYNV